MTRSVRAVAAVCCLVAVPPNVAFAQDAPACVAPVLMLPEAANLLRMPEAELQRLAEQEMVPARLVGSAWRFNCTALLEWLNGARAATQPEPPAAAAAQAPVGEAPEEQAAEDILLRGQRVLLARGQVVIDVGQVYSRSDTQQLAAVGGGVGLATSRQEVFATLFVARVGVFDETELFGSTTFRVQHSEQFAGAARLASRRDSAPGDVQLGVRRTLLRERAGVPDIILSVDALIPTGDTPYGAGAGVVLVKSVDPVVLFAGANYRRLFDRDSLSIDVPFVRERWGVSFGYGVGLNDTLAISMAVSGSFAGDAVLDDGAAAVTDGTVYGARFGLTSWLARGLYIEPSFTFALSGPGNSFAFAVTLPYAF